MSEPAQPLRPPEEIVAAYPPAQDALFALLRPRVTDEMLSVVAKCDYGEAWEAHLTELERIRSGIDLDRPIGWEPNEVLCLFRWSADEDEKSFRDPIAFHTARAFCCAALLRVPDHVENRTLFESDTLAPLLESCLFLGEPFRFHLGCLLTWTLGKMEGTEPDYLFHAFGLLLVAAHEPEPDRDRVGSLGRWLMQANAEIMATTEEFTHENPLTFMDFPHHLNQPERWRRFAEALKARDVVDDELRPFLDQIAKGKSLSQRAADVGAVLRTVPLVAGSLQEMWRKKEG
ncbi:MAG: hypothetical protein ACO1SV_09055 [Fimbriimonas sp.]